MRFRRRVRTRQSGLLLVVGLVMWGVPASSAAAKPPAVVSWLANGHAYRHGVVPQRGLQRNSSTFSTSGGNLFYGGGVGGVGVTTGAPKVYLVFWGSQWDTPSNGDPQRMASYVQQFIADVGTGAEKWSGVMTQYCQGVTSGSTSCPSSAQHVGYPSGGALAGTWVDDSVAAPSQATGHQIGQEAVNAATHFGNTTQVSNRNTQYVVISPHGTHPDGFPSSGFCAWHDYTGDATLPGGAVSSPDGQLAFTNLPYIPDAGSSCGAGFVNTPGTLDGVTIVEGHEYAETITDQFPAGGWTDSQGEEDADKCAWISSGQGAAQNVKFGTGTFPVQSTWANDLNGSGTGGCELSHPIVGNTVTVTDPGNQSSTVGTPVTLQIHATDSGGAGLTYSAAGLPTGLSISSSTGLISGTPTTAGTSSVTVTATDTTGASGSTLFTWTVANASSCTAAQLLANPGFETGSANPWGVTSGVIRRTSTAEPSHSGNWFAGLDGYGTTHTDTLWQKVAIPAGCSTYTFSFWLHVDTAETTTTANDKLKVQVTNSSGALLGTLATYSNLNAATGYVKRSFDLSAYAGQTVRLAFTGTENASLQTTFAVDDTALNVS